ncbi:MAG: imidazole glycerol phosphate synthase subunit HisH [Clostridiaceae bacterium]
MIGIVDYGCGNLFSLSSALKALGIQWIISGDKKELQEADKLILPGVGAFEDAMIKLREKELDTFIIEEARKGKYILGICLGMQLLLEKSYEYGEHKGLSLISGEVKYLGDSVRKELKIPHMGWNQLIFKKEDPIFKYISSGTFMYFVHSFYGVGCTESILAEAEYDVAVPAIIKSGSVYGMQFHPEKSGQEGLKLLKAFEELR